MTIPAERFRKHPRGHTRLIVAAFFSICFGIGIFVYMLFPNATDKSDYNALVRAAETRRSEEPLSPYIARQYRTSVRKDILFTEKEGRIQLKLLSTDTELVFDQNEEKLQIIENMHDVHCYMQEELFYLLPNGREVKKTKEGTFVLKDKNESVETEESLLKPMQIIRVLDAAFASYTYSTDLFVAQNATVARYLLQGHTFTDDISQGKLMMNGIAQTIEFSLGGESLNFKAYQLKAKFYPLEKL